MTPMDFVTNVVGLGYNKKKGQKMNFTIDYGYVCVYCETVLNTHICTLCNEYDGVMTFAQAAEYLPEDFGYLV